MREMISKFWDVPSISRRLEAIDASQQLSQLGVTHGVVWVRQNQALPQGGDVGFRQRSAQLGPVEVAELSAELDEAPRCPVDGLSVSCGSVSPPGWGLTARLGLLGSGHDVVVVGGHSVLGEKLFDRDSGFSPLAARAVLRGVARAPQCPGDGTQKRRPNETDAGASLATFRRESGFDRHFDCIRCPMSLMQLAIQAHTPALHTGHASRGPAGVPCRSALS